MGESGTLRKVNPHQLLKHFSSSYDSGLLRVRSNSVSWSIYVYRGKITYASHSVAAFDRLSCHLRRLYYERSLSAEGILSQLDRIQLRSNNRLTQTPEYEAICSLVIQGYLDKHQAASLIERLTKEAVQSFLLILAGSYEIETGFEFDPSFCELDVSDTLKYCQEQVSKWQSLGSEIWSPYQRPWLPSLAKVQEELTVESASELNGMLKGQFSFYHLAVVLGEDELGLAQRILPYIIKNLVSLGEPLFPFNQLPKIIPNPGLAAPAQSTPKAGENLVKLGQPLNNPLVRKRDINADEGCPSFTGLFATATTHRLQQVHVTKGGKSTYTIAFVDDSPSMLKQISLYLADESFKPVPIEQPIKALMQILRHKPDIILLDIQMAQLDSYDLCKCLRNNSAFKKTPIIMVTGNTGIIDRVRAKMVGASGYLTKPFDQAELLTTVFKYLN